MTSKNTDDLSNTEFWTTKNVISQQAQERPDKVAIRFIDGPQWTFLDIERQAKSVAAGLQALGIAPGEHVAAMLKNGPEYCATWWGTHFAGAVLVGVNTELLGSFLQHALTISAAKILVIDGAFLERISAFKDDLPELKQLVVVGSVAEWPGLSHLKWPVMAFSQLPRQSIDYQSVALKPRDLACLIFTSGTTGPSKAVMMPHAHCYLFGLGLIEHGALTSDDTYYVNMPLYHVNAMLMQVYGSLMVGATAVIRERFSASCWLSDIRDYKVSHTNLLGVMGEFIVRQAATAEDKTHGLKTIFAAPATKHFVDLFNTRFGVAHMLELYGMSEVNIPLYSTPSTAKVGSCGKPYSRYFEVRIADPITDEPLTAGKTGEIQVRPKQAFAFMSGYFNMPEQTAQAWRNLWFHTGDAGYCDEQGYFYFVDRIKDSIRCRGENVSSFEVESVMLSFSNIIECAVVAVASEISGGEDEVLAVVATQDGELNVQSILEQARAAIPKYAVPRYVRLLASDKFPRTATNKIQKIILREQGLTPDTWDAERQSVVGASPGRTVK